MADVFINSFVNGGYYNDKTGKYELPKFESSNF